MMTLRGFYREWIVLMIFPLGLMLFAMCQPHSPALADSTIEVVPTFTAIEEEGDGVVVAPQLGCEPALNEQNPASLEEAIGTGVALESVK